MDLNKKLKSAGLTLTFCAASAAAAYGAVRLNPDLPENQKMLEEKYPLAAKCDPDKDPTWVYYNKGPSAVQDFVDKRTVSNLMRLGQFGLAAGAAALATVVACRARRPKNG